MQIQMHVQRWIADVEVRAGAEWRQPMPNTFDLTVRCVGVNPDRFEARATALGRDWFTVGPLPTYDQAAAQGRNELARRICTL